MKGDRNNYLACFYIGRLYENGKGVDSDLKEAVKWYEQAAKLGYKAAARHIDRLRKSGKITDGEKKTNDRKK